MAIKQTTAAAASLLVKPTGGELKQIICDNEGAAQWIQVHNTTSVPADTAVPVISIRVPADTTFTYDPPEGGVYLDTGIAICNSSTQATKTIGAADCFITAIYE